MPVFRSPRFRFRRRAFVPGLPSSRTLLVSPGHLVLGGKAINLAYYPILVGHLVLTGRTIAASLSAVVAPAHLLLSGKAMLGTFGMGVSPAHLILGTQSVTVSELVPPATRAPLLIPRSGTRRATRWRGVPMR